MPPRDEDSLSPFLQKLASKRQAPELQQQAAASVALYYDLMKTWATAPEANAEVEAVRAPSRHLPEPRRILLT